MDLNKKFIENVEEIEELCFSNNPPNIETVNKAIKVLEVLKKHYITPDEISDGYDAAIIFRCDYVGGFLVINFYDDGETLLIHYTKEDIEAGNYDSYTVMPFTYRKLERRIIYC